VDFDFDVVVARLRSLGAIAGGEAAQAAVATVLRRGPRGAELLLIRRAEREGDPWSGHIAFPGGMRSQEDATLLETARRETFEEVGLSLDASLLVTRLDDLRAMRNGVLVAQFVFALGAPPPPLVLSGEVAGTLWAPLEDVAAPEAQRAAPALPSVELGSYRVWGMTYRMIRRLLATLEDP
jgi:8-oxo-dGTP pyrophosphatase MutT (NUDIX family)